jgi:hypothetical protein
MGSEVFFTFALYEAGSFERKYYRKLNSINQCVIFYEKIVSESNLHLNRSLKSQTIKEKLGFISKVLINDFEEKRRNVKLL